MTIAALRLPRVSGAPRLHNAALRAAALALLLLLLLPALALLGGALFLDSRGFLLLSTLFYMLGQTAYFVGGALALALALALPAAWAVAMLDFRGRRLAVWLLFLPFALPPYLSAYAYDDLLRSFGISGGGALAIAVTALAVYPYIFFLARAAFLQQHCHIRSAARLLGCSPAAAFRRVSLPLARPAIAAGMALAAMEALNDVAVAEYFGLQTLGAGIYDLWLNRGDMIAGARLALFLMALALALVWAEEHARRRQAHYAAVCDKCYECERAAPVTGARCALLWLALLMPSAAGFWLPAGYLAYLSAAAEGWLQPLQDGLTGSLLLSGLLAALLLCAGALPALEKRLNRRGAVMRLLARLARVMYALPGAVIAQGVFFLAMAVYAASGWSLMGAGGIALLLFACSARFFILAAGALENSMDKISPRLDAAARLAALSPLRCFWRVHLPLLRPAAAMAAVMIFMEGVKELPMTLILRPFNFDTLSVIVYQYASDENLTAAAPSALLMAAAGAAAVTVLFALEGRRDRLAAGQRAA